MDTSIKTFEDLEFQPWASRHEVTPSSFSGLLGAEQAIMEFPNGYGVSVLFGEAFYSNGIDTYELAVLHNGHLDYTTEVTNDVLAYITKEEVTAAMITIQKLPVKDDE